MKLSRDNQRIVGNIMYDMELSVSEIMWYLEHVWNKWFMSKLFLPEEEITVPN